MKHSATALMVGALLLAACTDGAAPTTTTATTATTSPATTTTTIASTTTTTTRPTTTTAAPTTSATDSGTWEARFPGFEVLFGIEVPNATEAWCRSHPEAVLESFIGIFDANDFEEHWQIAMAELEAVDYDVEAWRQDDKYENGFWAWRSACDSANRLANYAPPEVDPLLTIEVADEAALWCSVHQDEVLQAFYALHEANATGQIDDMWTIAGFVLQRFDYEVAEWRQLDTFEVGFWAWRASCQIAFDSR